jgi:hypothetical protein
MHRCEAFQRGTERQTWQAAFMKYGTSTLGVIAGSLRYEW